MKGPEDLSKAYVLMDNSHSAFKAIRKLDQMMKWGVKLRVRIYEAPYERRNNDMNPQGYFQQNNNPIQNFMFNIMSMMLPPQMLQRGGYRNNYNYPYNHYQQGYRQNYQEPYHMQRAPQYSHNGYSNYYPRNRNQNTVSN